MAKQRSVNPSGSLRFSLKIDKPVAEKSTEEKPLVGGASSYTLKRAREFKRKGAESQAVPNAVLEIPPTN